MKVKILMISDDGCIEDEDKDGIVVVSDDETIAYLISFSTYHLFMINNDSFFVHR